MSTLRKHAHVFGVVGIYLAAFQNLQADASVGIEGQERASARLAHILHHTTHTDGAVELATQEREQFLVRHVLEVGKITVERMAHKTYHLGQVGLGVLLLIELAQIGKGLLLYIHEHTGYHLLPLYGGTFQAIGHHIVDVLDEDHLALQVVEVLDECSMAARTEQQTTVIGPEGRVVHVGGNGVCAGLLHAERHIVMNLIGFGIVVHDPLQKLLEQRLVFGAHGKVDLRLSLRAGIESSLGQVFLQGRTHASVGIAVEEQESLGKLAIVEAFGLEHVGHHVLVAASCHQRVYTLALVALASLVEGIEEGELVDAVEISLLKVGSGHIVGRVEKFEHILEHAAGCTTRRHEFGNVVALHLVVLPLLDVGFHLVVLGCDDTVTDGGRTL